LTVETSDIILMHEPTLLKVLSHWTQKLQLLSSVKALLGSICIICLFSFQWT